MDLYEFTEEEKRAASQTTENKMSITEVNQVYDTS